MRVVILIGLPGAGKSTWIKRNTWGDVSICSADHWHEGPGGYSFEIEDRSLAHGACLRKFVNLVSTPMHYYRTTTPLSRESTVVVDNTNVMLYDLAPYVQIASAFGHFPELVLLECPVEVSHARNVHQVPLSVIEHMDYCLTRLIENWPNYWQPPHKVPFGGV